MQESRTPPQHSFSERHRKCLACVASCIIPASAERGLPGADDPAILGDILQTAGRDVDDIVTALDVLDGAAAGALAEQADADRAETIAVFRRENARLARVLSAVVARCYYRDPRVMKAIGLEPRPPFPGGYEVSPGDWDLLEPVRAKGKIYRDPGKG